MSNFSEIEISHRAEGRWSQNQERIELHPRELGPFPWPCPSFSSLIQKTSSMSTLL